MMAIMLLLLLLELELELDLELELLGLLLEEMVTCEVPEQRPGGLTDSWYST